MRKTVLAKSIAALIAGAGLVAGAQAGVVVNSAASGNALAVNTDGIGSMLVVPYYSVQAGNDSYLNIVNTDTINGKAVKVRFRAAANSDDVYDITVLMSPGDMWSAAVYAESATSAARLVTRDLSCTIPADKSKVNVAFPADRTNGKNVLETREGYVEAFVMADIPPATATTSTFARIKHTATGGAPTGCAAAETALLSTTLVGSSTYGDYTAVGLDYPTGGLFANWTVINVVKGQAYTGPATAIETVDATLGNANSAANLVFFPQRATPVSSTDIAQFTADPLLRRVGGASYDLPDFSTPYVGAGGSLGAISQADRVTAALAVTSVANEYITDTKVNADTDWVLSMPTRRYHVAVDYAATTAANAIVSNSTGDNYFRAGLNGNLTYDATKKQICVNNIVFTGTGLGFTSDREEYFLSDPSEAVISPGTPEVGVPFCGEVSVLSFNNGGVSDALGGTIALRGVSVAPRADGWMRLATPGAEPAYGLPVIGYAAINFVNSSTASGNTLGNYSFTFPHRSTRPVNN